MGQSEASGSAGAASRARRPAQVRLPGFIAPTEDVGLGDAIKRATTAVGIRPCGGCAQRAEALNRWVTFTR